MCCYPRLSDACSVEKHTWALFHRFDWSTFYVFMLIGLTILNILPYISWEMEWGKIIMSLVRTDASVQFQTMELSPYVVENYSAIEALQKTVLLSVLFFWGIGMLVFAFNYAFQNFFGIVVAVVLIFLILESIICLAVLCGIDFHQCPLWNYQS